jgi:hypothetical protein
MALVASCLLMGGCHDTGSGALLGAGIGALFGQAIGGDTQSTVTGAAWGAAIGAAAGSGHSSYHGGYAAPSYTVHQHSYTTYGGYSHCDR